MDPGVDKAVAKAARVAVEAVVLPVVVKGARVDVKVARLPEVGKVVRVGKAENVPAVRNNSLSRATP